MSKATKKTKLYVPLPVYHKMLAYAKASEGEISGWGRITESMSGNDVLATIEEVMIFKQVVSGAHTELDAGVLTEFYLDLVKTGQNPGAWNLWWHSHHNFGVFFSVTDEKAIAQLKSKSLYSICINNDGLLAGRHDAGRKSDDIDVMVEPAIDPKITKACADEVHQKVKYEKFEKAVRFGLEYYDYDRTFDVSKYIRYYHPFHRKYGKAWPLCD